MDDDASKLPASPFTFTGRGFVPDVQLNVFGTLFHVHSIILKLQSHYFFKYLDAPGSPAPVSPAPVLGTTFKYNWTTKVVDGGKDWMLVSNNDKAGDLALSKFKGEPEEQIRAFHNLLCAMYSLGYTLENAKEFSTMTRMARFYAALPILSRSLSASILQSRGFLSQMDSNAEQLLGVAKELRHAELFKDCLLLYLGPWCSDFEPQIDDHKTNLLACTLRNRICHKIAVAQGGILDALAGRSYFEYDSADGRKFANKHYEIANESFEEIEHGPHGKACMPCFFRALKNADLMGAKFLKEDCLDTLFENYLILPALDDYQCHFLCAKILDEELPWDRTQN